MTNQTKCSMLNNNQPSQTDRRRSAPPLVVRRLGPGGCRRSKVGEAGMEEEGRRSAGRRRSKGATTARCASPGRATRSDEEVRRRKAAIQAALKKKRESEAKALHIAERLLEIDVTEEFLLDCIKFITAAHYRDLVEERSIIERCGYPICQNALGNVPKQQYKISTKTNRVYDITERKHFCSNFCYKASKYLEAQIPNDPLWSREPERIPACRLLNEQRGSAGEEVKFQNLNIRISDIDNPPFTGDQRVSSSSSNESDSSDSDQEFVSTILMEEKYKLKSAGHKQFKKKQQGISTNSVPARKFTELDHEVENIAQQLKEYRFETYSSRSSQDVGIDQLTFTQKEEAPQAADQDVPQTTLSSGLKDKDKLATSNFTTQGLSKKGAASLRNLISKSKQCRSATETDVLELLRQTLSEWNTEETLRFLYGSNLKHGRTQYSVSCQSSDATAQEQLDVDDLDSLEVVEIMNPNENISTGIQVKGPETTVRPLPNFEQLKQESEILHLKVREFYKGRYVLLDNTEDENEEHYQSTSAGSREEDPVLPLVDSEARNQIRKRIVLDALKKVLPKLLAPFQLSMSDIFSKLNGLIKTFRLTNKNIIHRTPEWTLIAVVLLSVLAVKISQLQESLQRLSSEPFVSAILKEFHIQIKELENLKNIFKCHDND